MHVFVFQHTIKCQQSQTFNYIWWQYCSQCSHIDWCHLKNWPRVVTSHWKSWKSYGQISECTEKTTWRGTWNQKLCLKGVLCLGVADTPIFIRHFQQKWCYLGIQCHPVFQRQLKNIPSLQRLGLSLKIVLLPLLEVMPTIAVARISIFLSIFLYCFTTQQWVAEQFLCIALQLPHLGLNKLFNYIMAFSVAFLCNGKQYKYSASAKDCELKT